MPSPKRTRKPRIIPAAVARRLLLHGQAVTDDPPRSPATPKTVARLIERMGFVQVDTISTVERAHHLILAARLNGYRQPMLSHVLETDRKLFEHWTHDASIIPLQWYPHWKFRFQRYAKGTWHKAQLGRRANQVLKNVLDRIAAEGPLSSRDFEHVGPKTSHFWWGWKPHKVALDHLWRTGVLHVAARKNFHKVYDLTERVIPKYAVLPAPTEPAHIAWACTTALERLGVATIREIAQFWHAISIAQAKHWIDAALISGEVIEVLSESADGSPPRLAYARADLSDRIDRLIDAPPITRLLSPFDPVLRDRARAKRLFNFDFRFEGFIPAAKRTHGYYVMALLEGDRFIGKVDPKFDRKTSTLKLGKPIWEPTIKPTRKRLAAYNYAAEQLAKWIGATSIKQAG